MDNDDDEILAEGLTRENEEKWRRCVENSLRGEDLWDLVSGNFARPPDGDAGLEEWTRKNDDALLAIRNSSGFHNAYHLRREDLQAQHAWEILTHIYDAPPEHVKVLNKLIYANDWDAIQETLEQHEDALTAKVDDSGQTALHVAAQGGNLRIVRKLIKRLQPQDLLKPDDDGFTPLSNAPFFGVDIDIAKRIYNKNKDTLITPDRYKRLPVTLAFTYGHIPLGLHLYEETIKHLQEQNLRIHDLPNGRALGANLLHSCFISQQLGTALKFISIAGNQNLLLEENGEGTSALQHIAILGRDSDVATDLLDKVCENVDILAGNCRDAGAALFQAARNGNLEFLKRVLNAYPTPMGLCDSKTIWNVFFYAVAHRQAQIFDHIRVLHTRDMLASMRDHNRNTLLHVAAILDSPVKLKLDRITGPALQMQRELQWFKEVESVVPNWVKEYHNDQGLTPRALFNQTHENLRKEGQEWMKGAATSGSVVAALVVTIMFTAAFTVPGGFDPNSGLPPLRDKQRDLFMTFIFSDAISLIFSIASVLTFLTILTSRYAVEDFLMSLPTKLICGLTTLILSIIAMFIAFSVTIIMMLHKTSFLWGYLPIIFFAVVLVIIFAWLQLSSFFEMVHSTFCPGIFNKNVGPWFNPIAVATAAAPVVAVAVAPVVAPALDVV